MAEAIWKAFVSRLAVKHVKPHEGGDTEHAQLHRAAIRAARDAIIAMRANREIGDEAFHLVEEELDWLEMTARG
jgi:hypothetical protein